LPQLIDGIQSDQTLRIWSVGCSKGQEPYSIAILCEELKLKHALDFKYQIFATDISESSLYKAQKGIYKIRDISNMKYKYLKTYFTQRSDEYYVKDEIKKHVYFYEHNIVTSKSEFLPDSISGKLDIVICNNLLIYYNNEVKQDIVEELFMSIRKGGYFVTSESEIDYVSRITKVKPMLNQSAILKKSKEVWM
jgi:chemotaxis methyl-accepting protein methylase